MRESQKFDYKMGFENNENPYGRYGRFISRSVRARFRLVLRHAFARRSCYDHFVPCDAGDNNRRYPRGYRVLGTFRISARTRERNRTINIDDDFRTIGERYYSICRELNTKLSRKRSFKLNIETRVIIWRFNENFPDYRCFNELPNLIVVGTRRTRARR